jgi:hypothetical protein
MILYSSRNASRSTQSLALALDIVSGLIRHHVPRAYTREAGLLARRSASIEFAVFSFRDDAFKTGHRAAADVSSAAVSSEVKPI